MDVLKNLINIISTFDIIYLVITGLSLIKCYKKGFVLSILSASKWLLAYIITLFLFPKIRPYTSNIIDNDYVLNILLGLMIFIFVIFVIFLINKGINKVVKYSGMGHMDKVFGFFFGFIRSYVIAVCIYTTIDIVYNYERWPINLDNSISFVWVEKGSNDLIKEFPSQKEHENAKEKIENL